MIITLNLDYIYFIGSLLMSCYGMYKLLKPKPLSDETKKILLFLKDKENWQFSYDWLLYKYYFSEMGTESLYIHPVKKEISVSGTGYDNLVNAAFTKHEKRLIFKKAMPIYKKLGQKIEIERKQKAIQHLANLLKGKK